MRERERERERERRERERERARETDRSFILKDKDFRQEPCLTIFPT